MFWICCVGAVCTYFICSNLISAKHRTATFQLKTRDRPMMTNDRTTTVNNNNNNNFVTGFQLKFKRVYSIKCDFYTICLLCREIATQSKRCPQFGASIFAVSFNQFEPVTMLSLGRLKLLKQYRVNSRALRNGNHKLILLTPAYFIFFREME